MPKKLKKYSICASVVGSKYLGEVEAESKEEAIDLGWNLGESCISLCHQCASECEDAEVNEIFAEEVEDRD